MILDARLCFAVYSLLYAPVHSTMNGTHLSYCKNALQNCSSNVCVWCVHVTSNSRWGGKIQFEQRIPSLFDDEMDTADICSILLSAIRLFIHFRHIPATYTACITKCVHTHTAMDKKFPLKCFSGELLSGPKLQQQPQQQQKKHFLHCSRNTRIQHRQWFGADDNTASPIRHRTVFHPPQHTETVSYTNERDTHRKYAKEQHEHKFFVGS